MEFALKLLNGGAGSLAAYLAAHVLLCLLPAFFIAGAMAALIPKASITRWLGRSTPAYVSYPAAAAAGSLIAVCSCTIVPLFVGIYRKGAGIGPAITFCFLLRRATSWRWLTPAASWRLNLPSHDCCCACCTVSASAC
ncbi:permease [Rhodoferax sp.]|uniref:permease n=1 Tax=Rhodoferax sp. TaxID=50421 RepID=UPI002725B915|nr:permease [Rhodoferax sp.]MDO8317976.1 permease [Rhodoferax sp.]MDP2678324.1 permease [Rhodoferax sp.]